MAVRYQLTGESAAEIVAGVEEGVRRGALPAGAALPPVRALAEQLGLSPATVAKAYQALRQRGIVATAGRNGTRVRARPPLATRRTAPDTPVPVGVVDLSHGEPDPGLLPDLGRHLRALASDSGTPITYTTGGPRPDLLDLARQRLLADGVPATRAVLTVTGGALDGIERLLTAHTRPGDRVALEDPGWAAVLDLVAALGLEPLGVPVDDDGPTEAGLRRALAAGARAVIVTSRAHNPTGAALGRVRAAGLRRVLRDHPDVLLIEDDHAAELSAVPLHALAGAATAWAFVRSVSKPYGPDLRLAVLAGDEATMARVAGRQRLGSGWVSTVLQRLVEQLWRDDRVTDAITRAGAEYDLRRNAVLTALAAHGIRAHGRTGLNVWVPVADEAAAVAGLRDRGYAVAPGSRFRLATGPGVRITVSRLPVNSAHDVADAVAEAIHHRPGGYTV